MNCGRASIRRGKGGPFTHQHDLLKVRDELSANYILTHAETTYGRILRPHDCGSARTEEKLLEKYGGAEGYSKHLDETRPF
jgi:hypothetical protein